MEKAARCARNPGSQNRDPGQPGLFFSQAVKSCPDTVRGWFGEGGALRAIPVSKIETRASQVCFFRKL